MKKGEQASYEMVKDVNSQLLRDGVEVRRRWAGPECGRCQGGKCQCSWQLADADVGRFEWKSNIASGSKGGSE